MIYEIGTEDISSNSYFFERHIDVNCIEHIHSHMEIVFVDDGFLMLTTDKKEYHLKKGQMAVVMPYEIHSYKTESRSDMHVLTFSPELISEYRQMFSNSVFENPVCPISGNLNSVLSEYEESENDSFKTKAVIYYSISEFINNSPLMEKKTAEYDVYRKAITYISKHYTENITLGQTAIDVGVTPVHLSRVLNSRGKSGFSEIVNSLRIFHARRMIEQTNQPISYIAFESGYGSIRNFNRIFVKYFSESPKDVRKKTSI